MTVAGEFDLVTCPRCGGMDPAQYINDPPHTLCPDCKGDGQVERPAAIAYLEERQRRRDQREAI